MKKIILPAIILMSILSCQQQDNNKKQNAHQDKFTPKIDSILNLMTLEEKVGQMNQYNGFWDVTGPTPKEGDAKNKYEHLKKGLVGSMLNVRGVEAIRQVQKIAVEESRLGIPLIIGFDVIHGYQTMSPIPLAESASWDLESIKKSAEIAAAEASAAGINWTFAPMVDIARDARWGRVMEGAGEDTYLGSEIAKARVKGFQGDDLSAFNTIAACAKHFAGYGFSEAGRDYNTVEISSSTLYNTVLPPFKASVDAGVRTFMNSFNELNGVPATGNAFLQRDILKNEWNFNGFVVSDWGSVGEMIPWGYAEDLKDAAEKAANGGSDMDMESYAYVQHLVNLVNEGKVEEKLIDDSVRRILRVKYELGLFDDPYKYCDETREKEVIGNKKHHEASLDLAKKSIVLLKNEKNLLPLKKEGQKIAVIGALAADKNSSLGSWRGAAIDHSAVSVIEGLQAYDQNTYAYQKGADLLTEEASFMMEVKINETDKSGFSAAKNAARNADVVVMVLGEHGFQSGEGRSRTKLDLPGVQQELLETVFEVNQNIILVLNNGRPLVLDWADQNIPAIVEAWHLGNQSGNAIAQVLFGDYNPSGKLPISFPRNAGQVPIYYNKKNTGRPSDNGNPEVVFWSHYTDSKNDALYPFGHGLSYTNFEYSDLKVHGENLSVNDDIKVTVNLKNSGEYDGKEVVQLYIHDVAASTVRPIKELKKFSLTELKSGESKEIEFTLNKESLGFYSNEGEFKVEPGKFKIFVGGSSITSLETEIDLQ